MVDKDSSKSADSLVGKRLGDYELKSRLTMGGMSHIYLGVDTRLQRQAAVKVLTPELLEADETLTQRFQREAHAVANLDHDNIIAIYQYGEQEGVYFLAMKYVAGMDLADELARLRRSGTKMEIHRALRILEQVASALDFAHSQDVIHRDVKPSNILLDSNDRAILTDFGLVLQKSVDRTLGTAFGTPRYISPEQAIASEDAVPQSDIYSLAVIMFEILTGESLFKGVTPMEMALSHINEPPRSPRSVNRDIPPEVDAEILKALSKEPHKRHVTALEFVRAVKKGYGLSVEIEEESTKPYTVKTPPSTPTPSLPIPTKMLAELEKEGAVIRPVSRPKKRRRRWPMRLAMLWLVIVTTGAYLLSTPRGRASVEAWIDVLLNRAPGGVALGRDGPVILRYNYETFTFRNPNRDLLPVADLKFVRGRFEREVSFYGSTIQAGGLPPGQCIVILWEDRDVSIPSNWNCATPQVYQQETFSGSALFWRVDALIETFEVWLEDRLIKTCPAVKRNETKQCAIDWAVIHAS